MSTDSAKPDKQLHLLDELQSLLEEQIELVRKGSLSVLERLGKQANELVEKLAKTGIFELPEFNKRCAHLQELYQELCLAIKAQRADIAGKLSRVHKGKRVVETYRSNI